VDDVTERDLLGRAFEILRELLADDEGVDSGITVKPYAADLPDTGRDAVWEVTAPNYASQLLVEAFRRFTPRDVDRVLGGISPLVRKVLRDPPIVVVAPWLSPRSRDLLTAQNINYIDLTGNIRLKIARPAIRLRLDGAQHDPNPPERPPVRLRGSGINALVRVLVDVAPPYRLVDLAHVTGLSYAYVSRALEALDEDRLIDRQPKGKLVTDVDWQALLRARAEQYDLLKTNRARTYLARGGASALYRRLGETQEQALVTGSFAAAEYVRLTAPTQLVLYVQAIPEFVEQYDLMRAEQGANVVLLRAADESQFTNGVRQVEDGTFHVGISQLAQDLLAGNGRLPEEGDALLEWMASNTAAWRRPHLPDRG